MMRKEAGCSAKSHSLFWIRYKMLDVTTASICDALARCYVMRGTDLYNVWTNATHDAEARQRREAWRVRREDALLKSLYGIAAQPSWVSQFSELERRWTGAKDASEEAIVCSYGTKVWACLDDHPLKSNADALSRTLSGGSHVPTAVISKVAGKINPSATNLDDPFVLLDQLRPLAKKSAANAAVEGRWTLLPKSAAIYGGTPVSSNLVAVSVRAGLLSVSRLYRVFVWLLLRQLSRADTVTSSGNMFCGRDLVEALRAFIEAQRVQLSERCATISSAVSRQCKSGPEVTQKWLPFSALVVWMQSRWRGNSVRRRWGPEIRHRLEAKLFARRCAVEQRLVPAMLRFFRQTQLPVEQVVELTKSIERLESRLDDFFGNEESRFQAQWNSYLKKLTQFYLSECPLDADWQAFATNDGVVFVNVKTGRSQKENPNVLKIVAAKNRQWLKASRERESRISAAKLASDDLNRMKEQLRTVNKLLEAATLML